MRISSPQTPQIHLIESSPGGHLFVADGSRLFEADAELFATWGAAMAHGGTEAIDGLLREASLAGRPFIDDAPLSSPPLRALSLAIAQKCNLGCTYCYAGQGEFGGAAKNMTLADALRAVDLLVGDAGPGARLNLAFLGGEPLINRNVLRAATRRALELAGDRGAGITFSITTNGTLLNEDDGRFFEEHGFAVTVSIDGTGAAHDALRPFKGGRGSYDTVMRRVAPLLKMQQRMQVSARVTV